MFVIIYACLLYVKNININVYLYYIGGTVTSILNHGYDCKIFQNIDRLYMKIGVFYDVIYIPYMYQYYNHIIFTLLAGCLYLYSKKYKVIQTHVFTHVLITISHILVLINI